MLLLKNAYLIDGNGGTPQANQAVLIDGDRIVAVGDVQAMDIPPETEQVDLAGKTLLPGFIDCHVHILWNPDPTAKMPRPTRVPLRDKHYFKARSLLYGVKSTKMTVEAGFTTIRDVAAPNDAIFALRDSLAAGEFVGPRLLATGACITHIGGHGTESDSDMAIVADGAEEILRAVRTQAVAGADAIKIMGGTRPALSAPFRGRPGYMTEELIPGVNEAHRAGLKVAVHAHSSVVGIKDSIRAGVDSIEHGAPLDQEAVDLMVEHGTYLCPTLAVNPAAIQAIEQGFWTYPGSEDQIYRMRDNSYEAIALAKKAGVKIALGTDAAMPLVFHGDNAWEFELMVEHGLTPMESIVAGTRNAAENIGLLDEIGTIEAGKLADIVIVDGDPIQNISVLREQACIKLVLKAGQIIKNLGILPG
ncbi:MAG: amidohydrolase family protein [Aggregatilineales bacterium]